MQRYSPEVIERVRQLRSIGKTYGEIKFDLKIDVPKSTLSDWCKNVLLPSNHSERIAKLNFINLNKGRLIALETNKIKREEFFDRIKEINIPIARSIEETSVAKIALAMLCLGEASKSNRRTSFYLGNSDPKIILLFLSLLKLCFKFDIKKVRCTVQCRADQDINNLERYWKNITGVPDKLFYKTRIDPRTKGKITQRADYKGVLRVDYFDNRVRLELESLANLIYNRLTHKGR